MKSIKASIPSIITCLNLLCGVAVIFLDTEYAVYLIFLGAFWDLWDGMAARILNVQSDFGAELDSLADLVTFCIAPAFLLFNILETPYSYVCFLIPVFGALRLAKFNISTDQSYYFKGLATPSSGFLFCGIYMAMEYLTDYSLLIVLLILAICLLNVSSIKMFSAKGFTKDPYSKYYIGVLGLIFIISCVLNWKLSLLITIGSYLILSLIYHQQMNRFEASKN